MGRSDATETTVAKIHYEADGAVSAERFIAALTDFSERRPELWPNLDAKYYELHELGDTWADVTEGTDMFGGVWAHEHYDWSKPGHVQLRLVEAVDFLPGTVIDYLRDPTARWRLPCRGRFPAHRRQRAGRLIGVLVQLMSPARRFASDLPGDARSARAVQQLIRLGRQSPGQERHAARRVVAVTAASPICNRTR
jgi:hypothetical protein